MLDGHLRVVATAYGVSDVEDAAVLEAGEPQGCPASLIIWAILVDFAQAYYLVTPIRWVAQDTIWRGLRLRRDANTTAAAA